MDAHRQPRLDSPAAWAAPAVYTDVRPEQPAGMLEQEDFVLIDTNVPYEHAAELVDQLPAAKSATIVVYCRSDRMCRIAVEG